MILCNDSLHVESCWVHYASEAQSDSVLLLRPIFIFYFIRQRSETVEQQVVVVEEENVEVTEKVEVEVAAAANVEVRVCVS